MSLSKLGYSRACKHIFAYGRRPKGPASRQTEVVGFAFDHSTGQVLVVHEHGCYSHAPETKTCVMGAIFFLKNQMLNPGISKLKVVDPAAKSTFDPGFRV